jgi:hypothetical protein
MKITEINAIENAVIERNATPEEELQIKTEQELAAQVKADEIAEAQAKALQKAALLNRLGLTEDEAKLLLA